MSTTRKHAGCEHCGTFIELRRVRGRIYRRRFCSELCVRAASRERLRVQKRRQKRCRSCANPVVPGRHACAYHLEREALRQQIIRAEAELGREPSTVRARGQARRRLSKLRRRYILIRESYERYERRRT